MAMDDKQNALNNLSMVIETGEKKAEFYELRSSLYQALGDTIQYEQDMATIKRLGALASDAAEK